MKALITPTVNLNGNSKDDLVRQLVDVMAALRKASEAFLKNADVCHGRNFQHLIKGRDTTKHVLTVMDAQHAWAERREAIDKMYDDVERLALAINAQGADGPTDVGVILPEGEPAR